MKFIKNLINEAVSWVAVLFHENDMLIWIILSAIVVITAIIVLAVLKKKKKSKKNIPESGKFELVEEIVSTDSQNIIS